MNWSMYRTISMRYLQQRWSRAALVVASIALGVATLVATRALNQSMWSAAQASSRPMAGLADLHVGNGDAGVRYGLAKELAALPGIHEAMPLVVDRVVLPDLGNRQAMLMGIERSEEPLKDNPWKIEYVVTDLWRAALLGNRSVLVGSELAEDLSKVLPASAETFRVKVAGETRDLPRWVGTVKAAGPAVSLGGSVLYMEAGAAATLLGRPGLVSRIDLKLEEGADRDQVQSAVEAFLQGQAKVRTPEAQDQSIHDAMAGLQIGFTMCGAGALVVGLFLVYNALAVSVNERRHEIGILRSLGATREQIWGLFVGESCLLGATGAVLGVPLGIGLAHLGLMPMQTVFNDLFLAMKASQVVLGSETIIGASAAGIFTALLASLLPAVRAAAEQPANAVRRIPPPPGLAHQTTQVVVSSLFLSAGAGCMLLREHLPQRVGTYGCLTLTLLGLLLLSPLLAALLARLLSPIARRFMSLEGRLAADNLVRSPGRTGLVITALAAGVAMVLQTAGVIRSNKSVIGEWIDQSILADLFVSSGGPVGGNGQTSPMNEELRQQIIDSDPDIAAALPVRFRQVDFHERKVFLAAVDAGGCYEAVSKRPGHPESETYRRLSQAEQPAVVVSENFATLYHVAIGDDIELQGPRGPISLRVVGTLVDYSWNLGSVFMDRSQYRQEFEDSLVDVYDVFLREGADPEAVRTNIRRRWEVEHSLVILTRVELQQRIAEIIERLYSIAYSQEAVVAIVAALGVVTSLLISVMQRRSELGILRAIGATQAQVMRSVLAEAGFMGLIGAIIGLLIGLPIEWYILQVVLFEEAGFTFQVSIPWLEAGAIACLALIIPILAGIIPAMQTLRMRIPEAIAYE